MTPGARALAAGGSSVVVVSGGRASANAGSDGCGSAVDTRINASGSAGRYGAGNGVVVLTAPGRGAGHWSGSRSGSRRRNPTDYLYRSQTEHRNQRRVQKIVADHVLIEGRRRIGPATPLKSLRETVNEFEIALYK